MKVVHVILEFEGGGLESVVALLAQQLSRRGFGVSVVTLSGAVGATGAAVLPGIDEVVATKPLPVLSFALPAGLVRVLRELSPDIVHLHSGAWLKPAWAAVLAGNAGVVYTEHGREHNDPWHGRVRDRIAARITDMVVPVSRRLGEYLRSRLRIPAKKLRVIENGVDTHRFCPGASPGELRATLAIPSDAAIVGSVGRLESVKAYDRLISVVSDLPRDVMGRPVYLVICGDGTQRSNLMAEAERRGLTNRIRLPGWLRDPSEFYRLIDVFALTSKSEGLSVSLLEAMASSAVPLVTDVGANADVLGRSLASCVVAQSDLSRFRDRLAELLADTKRSVELGEEARRIVSSRFSADRMADAYVELYERIHGEA